MYSLDTSAPRYRFKILARIVMLLFSVTSERLFACQFESVCSATRSMTSVGTECTPYGTKICLPNQPWICYDVSHGLIWLSLWTVVAHCRVCRSSRACGLWSVVVCRYHATLVASSSSKEILLFGKGSNSSNFCSEHSLLGDPTVGTQLWCSSFLHHIYAWAKNSAYLSLLFMPHVTN